MDFRAKSWEAFLITATLMVLGLIGLVLEDGIYKWLTLSGMIGLLGTFAVFYVLILVWIIWYYRKR